MGKRGPAPSGGYGGKTGVLSTRITAELRESLRLAAAESGRSLSSEIEHRLRRSFDNDEVIGAYWGGPQLHALLRMIGASMLMSAEAWSRREAAKGRDAAPNWLNDPGAYEMALQATSTILERFRPPPFAGADYDDQGLMPAMQAIGIAQGLAFEVAAAEEALPLPNERVSDKEMLASRIANGLGPEGRDRLGRGISESLAGGTPSSAHPASPIWKATAELNKRTAKKIATINQRKGRGEKK